MSINSARSLLYQVARLLGGGETPAVLNEPLEARRRRAYSLGVVAERRQHHRLLPADRA